MTQIIAIALAMLLITSASAQSLKLPGKASDNKLALTLVKQFVAKSEDYDSIEFIYGDQGEPSTSKMLQDLQQGQLDLVWLGTSVQYERDYQAIYVPVYRGLLGMRIGLITNKNSNRFAGVSNLYQLQEFRACQGKTWADTNILKANNINVAASLKYPNLFDMLDGGRCDYFPRGVFEPFNELKSYAHFPFMIEPNLLIKYRMPYYLFVRKDNQTLAKKMTQIFTEMLLSGEFEQLFFADSEVSTALAQANLQQRQLIELVNPELTEQTKAIKAEFWFDPLQEAK
ncbi:ABC transporter substrate-binding protein [Paraferrimonas sp. SM1919]|uniref:substrate-binding periplasmic protein n=1 Tax=Paraferrimonas sp. SM1919 TaxID=2662263 RepID=UPI0013D8889E|nr:transporter substrate-binding domain-containing protein [Paraferrimonas sp. SM1919]